MAWCVYSRDGRIPNPDAIALRECSKGKSRSALRRQKEHSTGLRGEFLGTRQVVRVYMSLKDVSNVPSMPARQIDVDLGGQRRIDHGRLVTGSDNVRQATLASASHLYDSNGRVLKRYFSGIPGEAPRFHAADQRSRIEPAIGEYRRGRLAHTTGVADGDHRSVAWKHCIDQGTWLSIAQRVICVDMQAARNGPLGAILVATHV